MKKTTLFFLILTMGGSFLYFGEPPQVQADEAVTPTPAPTQAVTESKKSKHHQKTEDEKKPKPKDAPDEKTENQNQFYIGMGMGVDLPGTNWDPNYLLGSYTTLLAGYTLDKNLAVQLDLEQLLFTGTGYSLYQFRALVQAKYTFEGPGWQPYVLAGPGMVFQSLSPSGTSTSNFDALAGVGVQFDVIPQTHFFVEAKYNFIMSSSTTFGDIPISAGLWVGL